MFSLQLIDNAKKILDYGTDIQVEIQDNTFTIRIGINTFLKGIATHFPSTCGILIISKISYSSLTKVKRAFKLLEEMTKLERKSVMLYLLTSRQKEIEELLTHYGWEKMDHDFINHNSSAKNIFYIKKLYAK